jgi:hypothetical protein
MRTQSKHNCVLIEYKEQAILEKSTSYGYT